MEPSPAAGLIIQLAPLTILGWIYAPLVYITARKRRINPWGWTIGTAIPVIGLLISAIFFFTTLLSTLDRLNALEERSTFD